MEQELARLRAENAQLRQQLGQGTLEVPLAGAELTSEEYLRYGRQMIVPDFGSLPSQKKLKGARIVVIGAGGLGCPALAYLAGAGIGTIGIVDGDTVDVSNLHRQILHHTPGELKCESAKLYITRLNPFVTVKTYPFRLDPSNAFGIFADYDLVLDCTDTPLTRYLINDVAVVCGKTVVSGSGLKTEGQLSIYNFDTVGPCYRCFYPTPPPPDSVTSCSDGGVLGPAIGLVGTAMALETIKVLTGFYTRELFTPFLSGYAGYPQQQLRLFKMRRKQPQCAVCGDHPTIGRREIESHIDYLAFCGVLAINQLPREHRVLAREYHEKPTGLLIDVRPREQYAITSLTGSLNVPWDEFRKREGYEDLIGSKDDPVVVVCRYGNDSQRAVARLREHGYQARDIIGGLNQWTETVDSSVPKY